MDIETKKEVLRKLILDFVHELYFGEQDFDDVIEDQVRLLNVLLEEKSK